MALRLAFAVATHADAEVLIVDEALAVGDGYFQKKSIDRITDFQKRGGRCSSARTRLYYVALLCDQAIWLKQGTRGRRGPGARRRAGLRGLPPGEGARRCDAECRPGAGDGRDRWQASGRALTDVVVHDGSGYPRTNFAAGRPSPWTSRFETEDPSLAFHVRVGADREDGVQAFAVDTRGEPVGAADGPAPLPPASRASRAADRAGRVPPLRLPRRRDRRFTCTTCGSSSPASPSSRRTTPSGCSGRATSGRSRRTEPVEEMPAGRSAAGS